MLHASITYPLTSYLRVVTFYELLNSYFQMFTQLRVSIFNMPKGLPVVVEKQCRRETM